MLQLETKWMTNTLAKKAMLNNDFIACNNGQRLFVVGFGNLTSSGKNTYNVAIKDANDVLIREENNLYLDAITKIILGASPKAKANKETSESKNKHLNNIVEEYKRLEANLKKAILAFSDFQTLHNITTLKDAQEAQNKAKDARRKEAQIKRRSEEAQILRINKLRKWAKDSRRLELLQNLNNKLLEM
jgi:hypothetical protein